jgi:hypothetical protein
MFRSCHERVRGVPELSYFSSSNILKVSAGRCDAEARSLSASGTTVVPTDDIASTHSMTAEGGNQMIGRLEIHFDNDQEDAYDGIPDRLSWREQLRDEEEMRYVRRATK